MTHKHCLTFLFCIATTALSFAQNKKSITTQRINTPINIDADLTDAAWENAEVATDFIMYDPDNGKPIDQKKKTDVRILYDDQAIYIGVLLYDDEPSKIMKEITDRDDFGTSDFFGIYINGYNDGQQDFRFFVTAAGGQTDCLATEQLGEDYSWNAIWESKVKITEFGWAIEIKIPYAALRFSPETVQTWGLNFVREIRRDRQIYTWTHVDSKIGTVIQQAGV